MANGLDLFHLREWVCVKRKVIENRNLPPSELHRIPSRENVAPMENSILVPELSAASFFSDPYVLVDCSGSSHTNLRSEKHF